MRQRGLSGCLTSAGRAVASQFDACQYGGVLTVPAVKETTLSEGQGSSDPLLCCPPVTAAELSIADASTVAAMFKALGDPVRLRLFSKIASAPDGEACACDVGDLGVSQPTVSHHLKKLREAGLLESERR